MRDLDALDLVLGPDRVRQRVTVTLVVLGRRRLRYEDNYTLARYIQDLNSPKGSLGAQSFLELFLGFFKEHLT